MYEYPVDALIFKVFEIVFSKSNRKDHVVSINMAHDYLNDFFKRYTVYEHGIDYSSRERLLWLLIKSGYKIKDNRYLKLRVNYLTLEALRSHLVNEVNPLLVKTKYNNYNSMDLVAWHRSGNEELGNYQFHARVTFSYVLYTDNAVDNALSNILKFTINEFSAIHYKVDGKEIILVSIYVKESMRKKGHGSQLLSSFLKFVCKTYEKEIRIHAMTDEMRSLLKTLESKNILALSNHAGQYNYGVLYNPCKAGDVETK